MQIKMAASQFLGTSLSAYHIVTTGLYKRHGFYHRI